MRSVIVADVHAGAGHHAAAARFVDFLNHGFEEGNVLYLLGDIFDQWIGMDDDDPAVRDVVGALKALTERGVVTFFQRGNHDFLTGTAFFRHTGCMPLPDEFLCAIANHSILLAHGDTLVNDPAYLAFRQKIRRGWLGAIFSCLPLRARKYVVRRLRDNTAARGVRKSDGKFALDDSMVAARLNAMDCDLLIHGHLHQAGIFATGEYHRICLSDWSRGGSFVEIIGESIQLQFLNEAGEIDAARRQCYRAAIGDDRTTQ